MMRRIQRAMKRLLDFIVSVTLLTLLAPVVVLVALAVLFAMGRPVLFAQARPGLGGRIFTLYKFRSMADASSRSASDSDESRLTSLGRFLRRTSLDELPTLWNVIRGDMSLVGPRPLLVEYLERYSAEQMRRHEVRPGVTGWAQVNGRNALSWQGKFELDVWDVDNWSLWRDLRILSRTVWRVLSGRGTSHPGEATMTRFTGND